MFVLTLKNTKPTTIDEQTRKNLENNDISSIQDTIRAQPLMIHPYISNQNKIYNKESRKTKPDILYDIYIYVL
jgi:hypothetical protein